MENRQRHLPEAVCDLAFSAHVFPGAAVHSESEFTPLAAGTALQTKRFLLGKFPRSTPSLHLFTMFFSGCKIHPSLPLLSLPPSLPWTPPPRNRNALVRIRCPLRKASLQTEAKTLNSSLFFLPQACKKEGERVKLEAGVKLGTVRRIASHSIPLACK